MEIGVFSILAALAALAAILVVAFRNPVYSGLSLAFTSTCVAGLFALLGAPFLAAVQVLIYAGGVVVLYLFAVAALNLDGIGKSRQRPGPGLWLLAGVLGGILLGQLGICFWGVTAGSENPALGTGAALGKLLFREFLLPLETAAFLLLLGLLGTVLLARKERGSVESPGGGE